MSTSHHISPTAEIASDVDRTATKSIDSQSAPRTATLPGITSDGLATSSYEPDLGSVAYQTLSPVQDAFYENHTPRGLSFDSCNRNESLPVTTLLVECDDCGGAGLITHDHPNDPWAKTWTCSMCDGTGEVIPGCECCRDDAVEMFDGSYLCAAHAAEARADALLGAAP